MATNGQVALADQVRRMIAQTKVLLNDQLKRVLREEQMPVSGVKAELQLRIINYLHRLEETGDRADIERLSRLIYAPRGGLSSYSPSNSNNTPPSSLSPQYSSPMRQPYQSTNYSIMPQSFNSGRITFKESPFYSVVKPLTNVIECKARESTRDTVNAQVTLTAEVAEQIQNDQNLRVMVFCAADSSHSASAPSEIAFPHQVELKCNLDEVKANLRGLKNKPGSTRPADITTFIRKKAGYQNSVQMTYALTSKETTAQKFYLVVNLVQKRPVDELVGRLRKGKMITKERVIETMTRRAQDTDIVATSVVMSLKCPLSTLRIDTPCRSIGCTHNQCFDAASYLQLQEQAPTWTCPVCNKYSPFEALAMDLYVDSILKSTSKNEEQVTIEPNGAWSRHSTSDGPSRHNNPTPEDDDSDFDLVELPDTRVASLKQDAAQPNGHTRTPPHSSREDSLAPSSNRSGKRPASEVIDLTLSDDDEPPQAKLIKRSSTSHDLPRARYHDNISFTMPRPSPQAYNPYYDQMGL